MCSENQILEAIHSLKPGDDVGNVLVRYSEDIGKYAESGDVEFFVSLGQLLEQV